MDICEQIENLPIEIKYNIFECLPINIRIKLILDKSNEVHSTLAAYKHGRNLVDMYNDYNKLALDMKFNNNCDYKKNKKTLHMFGEISPTIFHNGTEKLYIPHPIYNALNSDFRDRMPGVYYHESKRKSIVSESDWDSISDNVYPKNRYITYEIYSASTKNRIYQCKTVPLEQIIKYMKSKTFDKKFDYNMHRYMMNKYILYTSSNEMKEMKKKWKIEKRNRRDRMLVYMEKHTKRRESKLMGIEDKCMKKIVRHEKKIKKELEINKKKELMKEKKERAIMAKEEKLTKKLLKKKR
tara:strand:- start:1018 stop:1905 length:888 start_codon:yes stop_codon:yes gene_type:complete